MGKTSNAAKQRWCKEHYTQIKVCVAPETAATFKAKCHSGGVSMASEISRFMCGQNADTPSKRAEAFPVATRVQRRKTLALLIKYIEAVKLAESNYCENIPTNLRNSCRYEAAEGTLSALEEALDILCGAYE